MRSRTRSLCRSIARGGIGAFRGDPDLRSDVSDEVRLRILILVRGRSMLETTYVSLRRLVLVAPFWRGCCSPAAAAPCAESPVTVTSAMRPSPAQVAGCATDHAASWMGCLVSAHPAFATAPISGLAIPGSNNAGTFNLDVQLRVQPGSRCAVAAAQHLDLGSVVSNGPRPRTRRSRSSWMPACDGSTCRLGSTEPMQ